MSCTDAHPSQKCSQIRRPRLSALPLVGSEMALMVLSKSTMYLEIIFYVSYIWNRSDLVTTIFLIIELLNAVLLIMKNSLNHLELSYKNINSLSILMLHL